MLVRMGRRRQVTPSLLYGDLMLMAISTIGFGGKRRTAVEEIMSKKFVSRLFRSVHQLPFGT